MSEKYHLGNFNALEDIKYLADKSNFINIYGEC